MLTQVDVLTEDPDLKKEINELIAEVVPEADAWKKTPNPVFGGQKPVDLIGTAKEPLLRDLLRASRQGMFS